MNYRAWIAAATAPVFLFAAPGAIAASGGCDIADVVYLAQRENATREKIRAECRSVRDARDCALTKIIRLAKDGMDEDEIAEQCRGDRTSGSGGARQSKQQDPRPSFATFCATPSGSCPLMVPMPAHAQCYCTGPWGTYYGVSR